MLWPPPPSILGKPTITTYLEDINYKKSLRYPPSLSVYMEASNRIRETTLARTSESSEYYTAKRNEMTRRGCHFCTVNCRKDCYGVKPKRHCNSKRDLLGILYIPLRAIGGGAVERKCSGRLRSGENSLSHIVAEPTQPSDISDLFLCLVCHMVSSGQA